MANSMKKENQVVSLIHNETPGEWLHHALADTIQVKCDIRDYLCLRQLLTRYEVTKVYHTAALSLVKTAIKDPIGVFDVNAMGTASLLEACRASHVDRILIMNTDKVYGEGMDATEDKPYKSGEPYQASKCCQGMIAESFLETYSMNIVMSHSCNVFGYDPYSNRIFPNVIKSCIQGVNPLLFTNDPSVREYIFVEDKIEALQTLMNDSSRIGSYNISTGWVYHQDDIVRAILEFFPALEPNLIEGTVPKQISRQSLKSNRWDWKPRWNFKDAIKRTIEMFQRYRNDWK